MMSVENPLANVSIAVIGAGAMGSAICSGLIESGLAKPEQIIVSNRTPGKLVALQNALGIRATASNLAAIDDAALVLLAVKPQVFPGVAAELAGHIGSNTVILSIMAGIPTGTVAAALRHEAVARAMPNVAAKVRRSISTWYAGQAVSNEQRQLVQTVLSAIGEGVAVESEPQIDMATAVSGSGPAMLALAAEAMIEGAVNIGVRRDLARQLVAQTFAGTAALLTLPEAQPGALRESVTSPGGTTAAGLLALENRAVRAAYIEAIQAAQRRALELGSNKK